MSITLVQRQRAEDGLGSLAAWSTIAGALLQIVLGLALAPHQNPGSPWFGLITGLNALSHLLLLVGLVGLLRSGAVGSGWLGQGGVLLTLVGFAVLILAEPTAFVNMDVATIFFSVATLVIMVGMLLAGVAAIQRGRWSGWERVTPLACGLFIPLVLLPAFALPGYASNYAIGVWGVCWLVLGLAMRAAEAPAS